MFGERIGDNGRVRVKICGITNADDARTAIDFGADALGFNFCSASKRHIDLQGNAEWIAQLPDDICKVAVLANPTPNEAIQYAQLPFIDALQLHGNESPAFCEMLAQRGIVFVKVLPIGKNDSLVAVPNFFTDTVLLDSVWQGNFGGGGEPFPWAIGRRFVENHPGFKVILAGGLKPENVAAAIKQVGPFGVDVASGVESSPGRKDRVRLRAFFIAIQSS
jgi:phosphoribosylanthranilate isomerase